MAQIREIKQRMVAVGTIQRITKTMQMIATAKFTAAVQRTKATQPYTEKIRELVAAVCSNPADLDHPIGPMVVPTGRVAGTALNRIERRGPCSTPQNVLEIKND